MSAINEPSLAPEQIKTFLQTLRTFSGLKIEFKILTGNSQLRAPTSGPASDTPRVLNRYTPTPEITVDFTGPDTPLLIASNGELLHAIEHLAAKVLRLEPEEHDRISFDAENFKLLRDRELQLIAEAAVEKVRTSGRPFAFQPMNSRERRLLHLALSSSGLPTASSGLGARRFVVLYPEGQEPLEPPKPPSNVDRTRAIRNSFRRR